MDECSLSSSSPSPLSTSSLSTCMSQRRICEAKAKDENENCRTKCEISIDSLMEKCKVSFYSSPSFYFSRTFLYSSFLMVPYINLSFYLMFLYLRFFVKLSYELDLTRCSFASEDCESNCLAQHQQPRSAHNTCLLQCTSLRDNCTAAAEKLKDGCILEAQNVWKEKCRDTCDTSYVSCLDDAQAVYDRCLTTECASLATASLAACQRQCRTTQRSNESSCMRRLDACMADCPVATN